MEASAFAKVNLSLQVRPPNASGLHPIRGLFQSIDWADNLTLETATEDSLSGPRGAEVVDGWSNLAWRAVASMRRRSGRAGGLNLRLAKEIPVAAGLGGGSADAAAALALSGEMLGVPGDDLAALAPDLGSDVAFCLVGGLAFVSGTGEKIEALDPLPRFGLALVVPPAEVATQAVYGAWDRLGGPEGPAIGARDLPPGLRDYGPLANDLFPAAVAVAPQIEDWRAELASAWGRSVALTGSGPTLFGIFVDVDEADDALSAVPVGARATRAAVPVDRGWEIKNRESRSENREER
jgi:4-diphosphocytidyl-2-C-methyl-D-erythritol kinase